jgi:hypothetical protein
MPGAKFLDSISAKLLILKRKKKINKKEKNTYMFMRQVKEMRLWLQKLEVDEGRTHGGRRHHCGMEDSRYSYF